MGDFAKNLTITGRMRNDPELVHWREVVSSWRNASERAKAISWDRLHLEAFPGIQNLRNLERQCNDAAARSKDAVKKKAASKKGRAAGMWVRILSSVLHDCYMKKLENGDLKQKRTLRQIRVLTKCQEFLSAGHERATRILPRLECLTRYRIFTKTRVLICTVDNTKRMLRTIEEGTADAATLGIPDHVSGRPMLDTAIMDEAACVLETAVPVIIALGVSNLTLVGDQHQLQPFSRVRDNNGASNHTRSLMERALDAGAPNQFLTEQYRMHPSICSVRS